VFCPKTEAKTHLGMKIYPTPAITFRPYPEFKIGLPYLMKAPKLDIVHTHGPFSLGNFGVKVARKQGIPKVTTFHTLLSEYVNYISRFGQKMTKSIAWKYCRYHYKKYDKIITPSAAIKKELPLKDKKKIEVIPTGIDTDFYKPIKGARKKLKIDKKKVYLYLGRVGDEKSIDVLIKGANSFLDDDSVFFIAGKGPALEKLQASTDDERIKFLGFLPDSKKPLYYSAADLFMTASTSETQGIVISEALACGTPVVGADAFAIPEMIDRGKDGFLFKPGEHKQLAEIVMNFKPTKKMSSHARKHALEFSVKKTTDKLERLYESVMK
jgi:glycosyltransferase involved in cell wall biosynthesis